MNNSRKNNQFNKFNEFIVNTALNSIRNFDSSPCPSENDLAALIDGNISSKERQKLFHHLDRCPECYHQWLVLATMKPSFLTQCKLNFGFRITNLFQSIQLQLLKTLNFRLCNIWSLFFSHLTPGKAITAGLGIAMGCMLFISIQTSMKQPNIQILPVASMISESCNELQLLYKNTDLNGLLIDRETWQVSVKNYGFNSTETTSNNIEEKFTDAFTAGVWTVQQQLRNPKSSNALTPNFSNTPYADDFELGRWCYMLRTAGFSNMTLSQQFWNRQYTVAEQYLIKYQQCIKNIEQNRRNVSERKTLFPESTLSLLPLDIQSYLIIKIKKINQLLKDAQKHPLSLKAHRIIAGYANDILCFIAVIP